MARQRAGTPEHHRAPGGPDRYALIGVNDLPLDVLLPDSAVRLRQAETLPLRQATEEFEKQIVMRVLERVRWNRSEAARILGIHRNSLKTMLTRWDLGNRADD